MHAKALAPQKEVILAIPVVKASLLAWTVAQLNDGHWVAPAATGALLPWSRSVFGPELKDFSL